MASAERKEAERKEAERVPIGDWVRPPVKPVTMNGPLEPPPVTGSTYHVATNGDDKTGDGSKSSPWGTVQYGMNRLHPGDRLYLRGGEYRATDATFARSGRADAYITVAGYPGEKAKVICGKGMGAFSLSAGSRWEPERLREEAYIVIRDLSIDAGDCNNAVRIRGPMMLDQYRHDLAAARHFRHNIWVVNNEITGGNGNESVLGAGHGAHHCVFSNNRIHDTKSGLNSYHYSDGTIIEWNTIYNSSRDDDDAGAIKSMAPGVIVRYNKVHNNSRSSTSKKPGWAPDSQGGKQWRFLQGVTGIYLDWAMLDDEQHPYPSGLAPEDPANYVYGNTVHHNNAGIYVYQSNGARVYDNVSYDNGRESTGGWVEGDRSKKWLSFVGPAGYGVAVTKSENVQVFGNISYNNEKAGLGIQEAYAFQGYGNVLFGNELAQVHIRKRSTVALGFNTILSVAGKGPPIRRYEKDFEDLESYREEFSYHDFGSVVRSVKQGTASLDLAQRWKAEREPSPGAWQEARAQLLAKAREARRGRHEARLVPQAPYDPTGSLQEPLPWTLPGTVEFENYDVGGPNRSYHDQDPDNMGGHYRRDPVDIKASAKAGNGAVVGFTQGGEWMEYTVSVVKAGAYPVVIAYATPEQGRKIQLTLDGKPLGKAITFPATKNWDDIQQIRTPPIQLETGDGVLRVTVEAGPVDLDTLTVKAR